MIGSAVAYGLTLRRLGVLVVDGSDDALRASRANFGLVWVQGKGRGHDDGGDAVAAADVGRPGAGGELVDHAVARRQPGAPRRTAMQTRPWRYGAVFGKLK